MSDSKVPEIPMEIIPVSLGGQSLLEKVTNTRNFLLQLGIENAAKMDGIDLKEGWKLNMQYGVWQRPKPKEIEDATKRAEDTAKS